MTRMLYARMHVDASLEAIVAAQWERLDVMTVAARIVCVVLILSVAEPCGIHLAPQRLS